MHGTFGQGFLCWMALAVSDSRPSRCWIEALSAGVPKESIEFPVQATRIPGLGDPNSGSGRLEPRVVRVADMESGLGQGLIQ